MKYVPIRLRSGFIADLPPGCEHVIEHVVRLPEFEAEGGFLAGSVPGSSTLNADGEPIGEQVVTPAMAEIPLAELFADVPQEPLPEHWEER